MIIKQIALFSTYKEDLEKEVNDFIKKYDYHDIEIQWHPYQPNTIMIIYKKRTD